MIEERKSDETRRASALKRHRRHPLAVAEAPPEETAALVVQQGPADLERRPEPRAPLAVKGAPPGVLDVLGNHRLAVGLSLAGVALLVAVVALGVSLSSLLVIGMVLLCPLGHVLMMRGHGHDSAEHGQPPAGGGGACHGAPEQTSARNAAPPRE